MSEKTAIQEQVIGEGTKLWYPEYSNIGKCHIGRNCIIHSHVWIGDNVIIRDNVRVQAFTFIPEGVVIMDDVFIGPRVTFTNDPKMSMRREDWQSTFVCRGARIGAGVVIVAGVHIGQDAMIGAGAVVTKSVPKGELWVGNPARRIQRK